MPQNPDEIGALWIKSGAKGDYLTGTINGVAVVVFRNDRKTGKQPDWRVLKAKPRDERGAPNVVKADAEPDTEIW